ncbi:unnamed protein product [Alopecurus aequalis]
MDGAGGDRSHRRVAVGGASPPSSLERSCNTPMVPAMNDPPGVSVPSPQLPVNEDTDLFYGALTAPLASPNSHLMVTTGSHNLFWRIGSHCWVRCSTHDLVINRVVAFKGQIFGMGHFSRLYIVHLVPHIHIQEMAVDCGDMLHGRTLSSQMFLVVCGDMLLMISCPRHFSSPVEAFQAFRLDLSAEPAKWVKVEKLEKWAIFISNDDRSQVLCCTDSERWGGRSNCIYCYDSKERVVICELGKQGASVPIFKGRYAMQPMWAVPSMIYSCR